MKTSFYFVLWIIIYPLLGLLNLRWVDENSFIITLLIVWGLSWILNRTMPNIITYERATQIAPILEDVYTGNVSSFSKRLTRDSVIESITAVYFLVTTILICIVIFVIGVNDWIALTVFAFFTYSAISRSISLIKANKSLRDNPTAEECMEIATDTYNLDYSSYYECRNLTAYENMLPQKPKYFKFFKALSIIIAGICTLLGILYILTSVIYTFNFAFTYEIISLAAMYFLYGTLATYFGIKDCISCVRNVVG